MANFFFFPLTKLPWGTSSLSHLLNAFFKILEFDTVPSHPGKTYVNFKSNVHAASTFCVG